MTQPKKLVRPDQRDGTPEIEVYAPGSEIWAQYQLEVLVLACKVFLNDLIGSDSTRPVREVINEFKSAIDVVDAKINERGSVVELLAQQKGKVDK
jgi:hypothetical protein